LKKANYTVTKMKGGKDSEKWYNYINCYMLLVN
jgi:hypothetical protein